MRAREHPAGKRPTFTRLRFWRQQGLSVRAASAVAAAGCRSLTELRRLGWRYFEGRDNCGKRTLAELCEFIGEWRDPPGNRDVWIRHASDDFLIEELCRRGHAVRRQQTV